MSTRRAADLASRIDHLLWTAWDPIGANDLGAPRDEYRGYAADIARLLERDADVDEIADHLLRLEREMMSLPGDASRARRVAILLLVAHATR